MSESVTAVEAVGVSGASPVAASSTPTGGARAVMADVAWRRRAIPLVLALAAFGFAVAAIEPWPVGVFQDDGIYLILGKSLATGHGYRYLQMPGMPNATHYPPLYPALLAALWKLYPTFPQNVTLFKFANAVLLAVAAVGFHWFARRRLGLGEAAAAGGTLLFTACAPVILLTVMVLSEPLFLALLAPALLLSERAAESGKVRDAAMAALLAVVLALVRSLGLLIVPATALVLAWRRRWAAAATLCLVAGVAMLPWQLWVAAHAHEVPPIYLGKYGSYLGWLTNAIASDGWGFVLRVARMNLAYVIAQGWASTATDTLSAWLRWPVTVALVAFFACGLWSLVRRAPATAWFVVAYLGIVLIWPFAPARFTWGIWPLVGVIYALAMVVVWEWGRKTWRAPLVGAEGAPWGRGAEGGEVTAGGGVAAGPPPGNTFATAADSAATISLRTASLERGTGHGLVFTLLPWARYAALGTLAALLVGYGTYNWLGVRNGWWTVVQQSVADRARPLAEWVAANTDSSAVIATDDDVLIHLYTGRRTIPNGVFTPQEHLVPQTPAIAVASLRTILATFQVDYVLASTSYGTYAVKGLVQEQPPTLRIVRALKTGGVFAPVRGPDGNAR